VEHNVHESFIEYLDPWDVRLWSERLRYYIENPDSVEQAEKLIRKKYTIYTWAETSRDVFIHFLLIVNLQHEHRAV
jgi:hypothetical protein